MDADENNVWFPKKFQLCAEYYLFIRIKTYLFLISNSYGHMDANNQN